VNDGVPGTVVLVRTRGVTHHDGLTIVAAGEPWDELVARTTERVANVVQRLDGAVGDEHRLVAQSEILEDERTQLLEARRRRVCVVFLVADCIQHRLHDIGMRMKMIGVLPEPHQPRRAEQPVEVPVASLERPHVRTLRSLMIEPRAAMPPSIVTIEPVI